MKRLLAWLIENYCDGDWISRADHDEAVSKYDLSVTKMRQDCSRENARLSAAVTRLTRERNAVLTEGLHRFALLPQDADRRGTLKSELKIEQAKRSPFSVGVTYTLSDEEFRPMAGPLRAVVIEQLAMLLVDRLKVALNRELIREE